MVPNMWTEVQTKLCTQIKGYLLLNASTQSGVSLPASYSFSGYILGPQV